MKAPILPPSETSPPLVVGLFAKGLGHLSADLFNSRYPRFQDYIGDNIERATALKDELAEEVALRETRIGEQASLLGLKKCHLETRLSASYELTYFNFDPQLIHPYKGDYAEIRLDPGQPNLVCDVDMEVDPPQDQELARMLEDWLASWAGMTLRSFSLSVRELYTKEAELHCVKSIISDIQREIIHPGWLEEIFGDAVRPAASPCDELETDTARRLHQGSMQKLQNLADVLAEVEHEISQFSPSEGLRLLLSATWASYYWNGNGEPSTSQVKQGRRLYRTALKEASDDREPRSIPELKAVLQRVGVWGGEGGWERKESHR